LRRVTGSRSGTTPPLTDDQPSLSSRKPSDRIVAAESLASGERLDAYETLVESLQGEEERDVRMAMLKALDTIGGKRADRKMVSEAGFGPVKELIMDNLGDSELVQVGLDALSWTCDLTNLDSAVEEIRTATENTHPETFSVATKFLGAMMTGR
jgi:hypothetical protein